MHVSQVQNVADGGNVVQMHEDDVAAFEKSVAKLRDDLPTAAEQKVCPVTGAPLGSMGAPVLVEVAGRKVWTCCNACPPKLKADPAKYLARLAPPPKDAVLTVPELAVIEHGYVDPPQKLFRVNGRPAVGIGISMKPGGNVQWWPLSARVLADCGGTVSVGQADRSGSRRGRSRRRFMARPTGVRGRKPEPTPW